MIQLTNSYHIHVTEEIDAFRKLTFEAQFQKLSPGGAVSYVEVPNMQGNIHIFHYFQCKGSGFRIRMRFPGHIPDAFT